MTDIIELPKRERTRKELTEYIIMRYMELKNGLPPQTTPRRSADILQFPAPDKSDSAALN